MGEKEGKAGSRWSSYKHKCLSPPPFFFPVKEKG